MLRTGTQWSILDYTSIVNESKQVATLSPDALVDAQLTLPDGTPVRLALPGPASPKPRSLWPALLMFLTLLCAGYSLWWSHQSWLFIDGPELVGDAPEGLAPALCQRLIGNLEPQLQGNPDPWLPSLNVSQFQARCLNGSPRLEIVAAQAANFLGWPSPTLALQAFKSRISGTCAAPCTGANTNASVTPSTPSP